MSTYEISKSSLLSLKAEILKKQEELQKTKAENKLKLQRDFHKRPLELKNRDIENHHSQDSSEDEDLLKKSRAALEAKSKLYEKLSKGSQNEVEKEFNRRYLVHFDQKANKSRSTPPLDDEDDYNEKDYPAENSDDEWIEYVDCFGRTRTCLKKDLDSFKKKDNEIQPRVGQANNHEDTKHTDKVEKGSRETESEDKKFDEESELLSGDMRRELQRQQWEKEEDELADKSNIHYQDILFSEARTHGVGYYGFSKDEEERAKQQAALKNLRKETEQQQKLAQEMRENRQKQMASRVRAARNRKRAREGLPPVTSDDEAAEEAAKAKETPEKIVPKTTPVDTIEEKRKEEIRKQHVRPWDIGKEGVEEARIKSGSRDPYEQDEWNEIQRSKRDREFAPPQAYHKERLNPYKTTPTPIRNECSSSSESEDELIRDYAKSRAGVNIPPPPTYDYYGPSNPKHPRMKKPGENMEDAIMQGLRYLRESMEKSTK